MPGRRTAGEIAEHIVYGRALHLCRAIGEVADLAPYQLWNDETALSKTAAEIVRGLEVTWRVLEGELMRGSSGGECTGEEAERVQAIWGLLDHDLPHAGQLSLLLRAMGLDGVDI